MAQKVTIFAFVLRGGTLLGPLYLYITHVRDDTSQSDQIYGEIENLK